MHFKCLIVLKDILGLEDTIGLNIRLQNLGIKDEAQIHLGKTLRIPAKLVTNPEHLQYELSTLSRHKALPVSLVNDFYEIDLYAPKPSSLSSGSYDPRMFPTYSSTSQLTWEMMRRTNSADASKLISVLNNYVGVNDEARFIEGKLSFPVTLVQHFDLFQEKLKALPTEHIQFTASIVGDFILIESKAKIKSYCATRNQESEDNEPSDHTMKSIRI